MHSFKAHHHIIIMLAVLVFFTEIVGADTGEESLWLTAVDKYDKGRYQAAAIDFQGIIQSRHSRYESAARLMLARCYSARKDFDAAETEVKKLLRKFPFGRYVTHGHYLLAEIDFERKNYTECAQRLLVIAQTAQDNDLKLLAREKLTGIFETHLDRTQRENVLGMVSDKRIVSELKMILDGYKPPVKVGIILDLSGRSADVGRDVLAGLKAAEEASREKVSHYLELVIGDTGGRVSQAVRAAKALIHQEDVVVLMGGLDGACAAAIAGVASENKVPLIVLGPQDDDLTELGDNIYQLMPDAKLEGSVTAYIAVNDLEAQRASILAPASEGGRLRVEGFKWMFEDLGGYVDSVQWYYRGATNYKRQLDALVQIGAYRLGEEYELTEEEILELIAWDEEKEEEEEIDQEEDEFILFSLEDEEVIEELTVLDSLFQVYVSPINYFDVLYLPIEGEEIAYLAPQIAASGFHGYMIGDVNCLDHIKLESDWRYINGMIFPANFRSPSALTRKPDISDWFPQKQTESPLNFRHLLGWDAFNFFATALEGAGRINSLRVDERLKKLRQFEAERLVMIFPEDKRKNLSLYILNFEDGWFHQLKSPREVAEIYLQ